MFSGAGNTKYVKKNLFPLQLRANGDGLDSLTRRLVTDMAVCPWRRNFLTSGPWHLMY